MTTPRSSWPAWWTGPNGPGRPEVRIGDAEREEAARALGEHYAAGRLTREEYDERADRVWRARTAGDLRPLFVDLPPVQTSRPQPAPPRGPVARHVPRGSVPRLPLVPLLLVALGLVVLLDAPGVILLVLLAVWWWSASVRWRRRRAEWAERMHGAWGCHRF